MTPKFLTLLASLDKYSSTLRDAVRLAVAHKSSAKFSHARGAKRSIFWYGKILAYKQKHKREVKEFVSVSSFHGLGALASQGPIRVYTLI